MLRNIVLWILALIITLASAVYQRKTGPTYPISGQFEINGKAVEYNLLRSYAETDQPVVLPIADTSVKVFVYFKRYKTNDTWTHKVMTREDDHLVAYLPQQPPAGKLEYYIKIEAGHESRILPADRSVVTRFKGAVPATVLAPHVIFMFLAMLVSVRAGIAAIAGTPGLFAYALWTCILVFIGGMILGPAVQKYAFDAYWTGIPFGHDLTDNKTLIAMIAWFLALWFSYKRQNARFWIILASVVTLIIFLIPHSMMGSELDYSQMPKDISLLNRQ